MVQTTRESSIVSHSPAVRLNLMSAKAWPTPEIPKAPISVETHGDPSTWTELFEWVPFRKWALSLKDYGGNKTRSTKDSANVPQASPRLPQRK